ncbi:hypothetical protein HanRHA438_Chr15g0685431 [Helianthus annuus]|nr:hypothetical protein HanRHA438_Chr15g0685431 [Helianthus annuus]
MATTTTATRGHHHHNHHSRHIAITTISDQPRPIHTLCLTRLSLYLFYHHPQPPLAAITTTINQPHPTLFQI